MADTTVSYASKVPNPVLRRPILIKEQNNNNATTKTDSSGSSSSSSGSDVTQQQGLGRSNLDRQLSTTNFDALVNVWVREKLGSGFTREDVDFSGITVKQRPIVFPRIGEALQTHKCFQEDFDNPGSVPLEWVYDKDLTVKSIITWSINNGFESQYLPIKDVKLIAPPVDERMNSMSSTLPALTDGCYTASQTTEQAFTFRQPISLAPYSEKRAYTEIKTYILDRTKFYCDFVITGFVNVYGHKKRKSWIRQEIKAGIEDLLMNQEGFEVVKAFGCEPEVVYKLLGECTGHVLAGCNVVTNDLETTV